MSRTLTLMFCLAICPAAAATAQDPRLGRLPEPARSQVVSVLTASQARGLPTEPLIDRALEGAAKGAPPALIVRAVERLRDELDAARAAFGDQASPAELTAGAGALRAGATPEDLGNLRSARAGRSLTVPAAILADLVAAGVPADTAVSAVLALAEAGDAEYIAFRRNVQRDIELGASPAAALGVRLQAASDLATSPGNVNQGAEGRRKRKP